ncbi:unnamed protein product [Rotaria socialis]
MPSSANKIDKPNAAIVLSSNQPVQVYYYDCGFMMPVNSSYLDRFGCLVLSFVFVSGNIFIFFIVATFFMKSITKTTTRFIAFLNAVWSNLCVSKTFH